MAIINSAGGTEVGVAVRVYENPGAPASSTNDVQTVTLTGATGGTFTLSFGGQATPPIAFNASAATVQAALQALSSIGSGNATVTGTGPYVVTFAGALANAPQTVMTANGASLTGSTPSIAVAHTTTGVTGTFTSIAGKGKLCSDTTNANLYINTGTLAGPTWALIAHA